MLSRMGVSFEIVRAGSSYPLIPGLAIIRLGADQAIPGYNDPALRRLAELPSGQPSTARPPPHAADAVRAHRDVQERTLDRIVCRKFGRMEWCDFFVAPDPDDADQRRRCAHFFADTPVHNGAMCKAFNDSGELSIDDRLPPDPQPPQLSVSEHCSRYGCCLEVSDSDDSDDDDNPLRGFAHGTCVNGTCVNGASWKAFAPPHVPLGSSAKRGSVRRQTACTHGWSPGAVFCPARGRACPDIIHRQKCPSFIDPNMTNSIRPSAHYHPPTMRRRAVAGVSRLCIHTPINPAIAWGDTWHLSCGPGGWKNLDVQPSNCYLVAAAAIIEHTAALVLLRTGIPAPVRRIIFEYLTSTDLRTWAMEAGNTRPPAVMPFELMATMPVLANPILDRAIISMGADTAWAGRPHLYNSYRTTNRECFRSLRYFTLHEMLGLCGAMAAEAVRRCTAEWMRAHKGDPRSLASHVIFGWETAIDKRVRGLDRDFDDQGAVLLSAAVICRPSIASQPSSWVNEAALASNIRELRNDDIPLPLLLPAKWLDDCKEGR